MRARRWAAEVAGAAEGLVEALERFDVEESARDAVHESGRLVREAGAEVRHQARSPEGRRLVHDARQGAHVVDATASHAAQTVQDRASNTAQTIRHKADETAEFVEEQWHDLKESVSQGVERVQEAAHVTAQETRQRGRMVAETGRRARKAPSNVMHHASQAMGAWKDGMAAGAGLVAAAGVVGLAAFVVLTIALVNWLNILVGAPGGTFIVALLYAVAAGGALAGARAARRKGRKEAKQHMQEARAEVSAVGRPLREAFSGRLVARRERPWRRPGIGRVDADETAYRAAVRRSASTETGEGDLAASIGEGHQEWNRR